MRRIIAYDFDGTITDRDTFYNVIKFAKGSLCCYLIFALYSPMLVLMKIGLINPDNVKQQIFSFVFKGMKYNEFKSICVDFANHNQDILRPKALDSIHKYSSCDDVVVYIVSASIKEWIQPFFAEYDLLFIATEIEVSKSGRLTGRFSTNNCNREEKVIRLLSIEPNRDDYELIAYGDSSGDDQLIELADKGYYNKFI